MRKALAAKRPVISVDTKKKELLGNYENAGRQWRPTHHPVVPRRIRLESSARRFQSAQCSSCSCAADARGAGTNAQQSRARPPRPRQCFARRRGFIREGLFADLVVFDPAAIADRATFEDLHQFAVGVKQLFVNGVQVLEDGGHTGARPGRALREPGKVT